MSKQYEQSEFSFSDLLPPEVFGNTFSGTDDEVSGPSVDDYLSGDEYGKSLRQKAASMPARIVISGKIGGSQTGYATIAAGDPFLFEFQLGYKVRIRKISLLNANSLVLTSIIINGVNNVLGGHGASGAILDPANNVELLLKTIPANTLCSVAGVNASAAPVAVSFAAFADVL